MLAGTWEPRTHVTCGALAGRSESEVRNDHVLSFATREIAHEGSGRTWSTTTLGGPTNLLYLTPRVAHRHSVWG